MLLRNLIIIIFISAINPLYPQTYLDPDASIEERVQDLLSRMTLEEKIGQMTQVGRQYLQPDDDITTYFLGSLLSGGGSAPSDYSPEGWANMYDDYQARALNTRLGIPLIYGVDAIHGHNNLVGAVIFPHNIGLGATRDPDLVREVCRITAIEVAGTGIDWTFAPCIAVPRDERWGRTYEGFGETPELQVMMAGPAVSGFQGDSLSDSNSILACAKHYVGDGGTTGGEDQGNVEIDEAELRAIHLPGYIEAIESGVGSIMASYNSWNGEKIHGNKYLLTDVLKNELGFEGFVVSDWSGIDQLPGDYTSDVEQSINAGLDMVMVPERYELFISTLTGLVNNGLVSQERIDDAVTRILRQKFALGLFEHPFTDRSLTGLVGSAGHREVGRQAVRESLVLLAKKDGILPLAKNGKKILVAGLHADNEGYQCGGWTISWQGFYWKSDDGTTILEAIENTVEGSEVVYSSDGADVTDADIAVAVIGETPYAESYGDRNDLSVVSSQRQMVQNLKKSGMPVVLILISGRPLIIDSVLPYTDAVFAAWLPGTEAQGIADILFGDYQPTGKLGHSWPRSMDQIPINFGDENYDPLFEYGHGLSSLEDSSPGTAPEYYAGAVADNGSYLHLSFTRDLNLSDVSASNFTIRINASEAAPDSLRLQNNDNKTLLLYPSKSLQSGDDVTVRYNGSGLKSTDGTPVTSFGNQKLYNIVTDNSEVYTIPCTIQAEDYFDMQGIQTEECSDTDGGLNVGWIDQGDWLTYQIYVPQTGEYHLKYRIASLSTAGEATAFFDDQLLTSTTFPVTGGWQVWTTVEQIVSLEAGQGILKILCKESGFNINWIAIEATSAVEYKNVSPSDITLMQNYPNPFNAETTIPYYLNSPCTISIRIFDLRGREIQILVEKQQSAGFHAVQWDGCSYPSGVYLIQLTANGYTKTGKLLLQK